MATKKTVDARLTTLESDVNTLKSDVTALKGTGETQVPVENNPPASGGVSASDFAALSLEVRTLKANAPNPDAQAEKDAKVTERLNRVESILARVVLALGDVYDNAKADVEALGGTWTGSGGN